ncbi:MAG: hypothetical protein M3680_17605, partial [Myxococcota bacterium]|nr:hypothetical protein [Myxococcota bacterium]
MMPPAQRRRIGEVVAAGVVTGVIAGLATGAIDAVWSWGPAAQFAPGIASRLRFVAFTAVAHAAAGAALGLVLTSVLLVLSRASRLGDLLRYGWREHLARRDRDPSDAVAGLAIVLVTLPCVAASLVIAYRLVLPYLATRKVLALVVVVAMVTALVAVAIAIPIGFVIARAVEVGLRRAAAAHPTLGRVLSAPSAPPLVAAA